MLNDSKTHTMKGDMMHRWKVTSAPKILSRTPIFVLEQSAKKRAGSQNIKAYVKIRSAPWVNVIAVTPDQSIVLVRQFRHGIEKVTVEIPAGLVRKRESSQMAAIRELREETGYVGDRAQLLGRWFPNPALQDNLCSTWLIRNARKIADPTPDDDEVIEILTVPICDISKLISSGKINHGLCLTAFLLLLLHRNKLSRKQRAPMRCK